MGKKTVNKKTKPLSIAMLGASGAVGGEALKTLLRFQNIKKLTLFGRRTLANVNAGMARQFKIDVNDEKAYQNRLRNHGIAICALGVGQPSKVSKEEFVKTDKTAALHFAKACKKDGIRHFQLLAAIGIDAKSKWFYLRTKGELVEELKALGFQRLSVFQPSVIVTPANRYGISQAVTLKVWPRLNFLFLRSWRKYRGVPVDVLGTAMAKNSLTEGKGYEILQWDDFYKLAAI